MLIKDDINLCGFKFWSGGKNRAELLTQSELEIVEGMLTDLYPDGITSTQINDFFWFDFDTICEWLGTTEEELDKRYKGEDDE